MMVVLALRPTADRSISGQVLAMPKAISAVSVSASGTWSPDRGRVRSTQPQRAHEARSPRASVGRRCSRSHCGQASAARSAASAAARGASAEGPPVGSAGIGVRASTAAHGPVRCAEPALPSRRPRSPHGFLRRVAGPRTAGVTALRHLPGTGASGCGSTLSILRADGCSAGRESRTTGPPRRARRHPVAWREQVQAHRPGIAAHKSEGRFTLKLATWNVNSLSVRLPQLLDWLGTNPVDTIVLQETKLVDDKFPQAELEAAGWHAAWHGQKTYNGVALLSRSAPEQVQKNIPGFDDEQARVITATVDGMRVVGAYFPNGQAPDSDKFVYKLRGLVDAFRMFEQPPKSWSWWDYRNLAFRRNQGMRIDHVLVGESLRAEVEACSIDKQPRRNQRPSDHAPV